MFSFAKITSFAVLALGTLASASAVPAVKDAAPIAVTAPVVIAAPVTVDPVVAPVTALEARASVPSIASIFANLTSALNPILSGLSTSTELATLESEVATITSLIQSASTSLSALSGQPQSVVLANLDGTGLLSTDDLAGLLGGLLNSVFGTLGPLTTGADAVGTLGVLTPILGVVGVLLAVVLGLVGVLAGPLLLVVIGLVLGLLPAVLGLLLPILLALLLL